MKSTFVKVIFFLVLTLLFTIIVGGLNVLYTSNQTAYFSYGLADGGLGYLSEDWFSNTRDPFPVFSFVVKNTYQYLGESFFYMYQILLNGIFLFSILGILDHYFHFSKSKYRYLAFAAVYLFAFSYVWPVDSQKTLFEGVANQFIGFSILLPNSFGVLLFLSVYLYLKEKPVWAVISLVSAGYFHTGLFLPGAVLVLAYMVNDYLEHKSLKRVLLLGGGAFLLVLPMMIYYYSTNQNAAPEQIGQATHILTNIRITQHAQVTEWWGADAIIKFLIMLAGILASYRTKLFPVIILGVLFVAAPALVTAVRPSNTISALQIWRISIFIVPLSSSVVLARLAANVLPSEDSKLFKWTLIYLFILLGVGLVFGWKEQIATIDRYDSLVSQDMMDFVKADGQPGDVYLIPPQDGRVDQFRFTTGIPIVVNWKSFPWNAVDSLEWYDRLQKTDRFYTLPEDKACEKLDQLQMDYGITHVVIAGDKRYICDGEEIYADEYYRVVQIVP